MLFVLLKDYYVSYLLSYKYMWLNFILNFISKKNLLTITKKVLIMRNFNYNFGPSFNHFAGPGRQSGPGFIRAAGRVLPTAVIYCSFNNSCLFNLYVLRTILWLEQPFIPLKLSYSHFFYGDEIIIRTWLFTQKNDFVFFRIEFHTLSFAQLKYLVESFAYRHCPDQIQVILIINLNLNL